MCHCFCWIDFGKSGGCCVVPILVKSDSLRIFGWKQVLYIFGKLIDRGTKFYKCPIFFRTVTQFTDQNKYAQKSHKC